jgi:putative transposase
MERDIFRNRHYNTPGHAHELTFSVYRCQNLFLNTNACELFLSELVAAREEYSFRLWAYVIMPNHVHLMLWPLENHYSIELITKTIKGRVAKKHIHSIEESDDTAILETYRVVEKGVKKYRIWQRGGGFDRNLWNPKAIHASIEYIEANPVRKMLVKSPAKYRWSSAHARETGKGVLPDEFNIPVKL